MKNIYSPSNIEVLMHCHVRVCPHPRADAPVVRDVIAAFLEAGVIEQDDSEPSGVYKTTHLGRAWVAALCNVPIPKIGYIDEMGRILEI